LRGTPKASIATHVIEDCDATGWRLSDKDHVSLEMKIRHKRRRPLGIAARSMARKLRQMFVQQL
jgi:hypothetical protein